MIICLFVCLFVCLSGKTVIFTLGICERDIKKSPNSIWRSVCPQIFSKPKKVLQNSVYACSPHISGSQFWTTFLTLFLNFFELFSQSDSRLPLAGSCLVENTVREQRDTVLLSVEIIDLSFSSKQCFFFSKLWKN